MGSSVLAPYAEKRTGKGAWAAARKETGNEKRGRNPGNSTGLKTRHYRVETS